MEALQSVKLKDRDRNPLSTQVMPFESARSSRIGMERGFNSLQVTCGQADVLIGKLSIFSFFKRMHSYNEAPSPAGIYGCSVYP
jgi:hypothetical protein